MPIRNRTGGLHRGTLFDTNLPSSSIDEDIFTDQTLLETGADGDLLLVLDVSEDPDVIKYITRSNLMGGFPSLTGSTDNTVVTVGGSNAIVGEANLTFDASTNVLQIGASSNIEPRLDLLNDENSAQIGLANATDDMVTGSADGDLVINSVGDHNVIFAQNDTKAITLDTDGDVTFANNIDGGTWLGSTIAVAQGGTGATSLNNLITLTTHTTGDYVATVTGGTGIDSTASTSGEGTTHTLSVDLNEVGEVNIADGDYIAFMDATDSNATKKEAIADVASLFAGTGLTASSSVIGVDASQTQITAVGTIGTGVWQGTAIASGYIAADAITAAKIADDAIGSEHIADDAVVTAAIADDAITSALIADDAVVAAAIADNSITMGTHTTGNYVATVTAGTGLTSTGATSGESIAHGLSVDAAQTGITSIYATDLIMGEDTQTAIDFGTANEIDFKVDNAARLTMTSGALYPVTNNQIDLGTASLEFKDAFFDGTVTADAFAGPLTGNVTGTADVATVATTVTITDNESTNEDNAITFTAGGDVDGGNIGLESDGTLTYNPSTGKVTATGFIGTLTGNVTGDVTGNVTGNTSGTAATVTGGTQASITNVANVVEVGALNAGSITSGFGTIDTGSSTITTTGVITAGGITIGSAAILEAELEIIDGATVTTTELNLLDGDTSVGGSITLADGDGFIVNDGGTMKTIPASDISAYVTAEGSMSNWVLEDDDGTEVTITNTKEIKLIGSGITTNWTDTDNGTDADPYDMTFTVDAAQTGITSIYATDLIMGEDSQTAIDFGTPNEIDFKADNAARLTLTSSALYPVTDNEIDLGTASLEFKDAFFDGTVTSDAFAGPLTGNVTGTADVATVATTVTITDNENTNENNAVIFTAGGDLDGGNLGLESDGDLHYNPSTGLLSTTGVTASGTVTFGSLSDGSVTVTAWVDEDNMASDSATLIPTQQSVKAYVDDNVSSGSMSNFVLEDDDGTEVSITNAKEVKLIGSGVTTNWTDTDNGTDADPYDMTITVDAAQTGITSIYATDLIMGEDAQTAIDFGTANEIDFKADNAARLTLTSSALYPVTDNEIDLGTASLEFKDAFFDGTVTSDAFAGPLTGNVTGTADVATVATTVTITDNENTNENNAIIFTAGGDLDGGNIGLESDGDLHYNPSTGLLTATSFAGALTGNVTGTADTATVATTVTITDNENTNENNAIIFTAGGDVDGGNIGLESDGDLTYNPSTGLLSSTGVTASGTMTFGSLSDGTITATAFVDEDDMSSNSATLIPTQQSVKAYVDDNAASVGLSVAMAIAL